MPKQAKKTPMPKSRAFLGEFLAQEVRRLDDAIKGMPDLDDYREKFGIPHSVNVLKRLQNLDDRLTNLNNHRLVSDTEVYTLRHQRDALLIRAQDAEKELSELKASIKKALGVRL